MIQAQASWFDFPPQGRPGSATTTAFCLPLPPYPFDEPPADWPPEPPPGDDPPGGGGGDPPADEDVPGWERPPAWIWWMWWYQWGIDGNFGFPGFWQPA